MRTSSISTVLLAVWMAFPATALAQENTQESFLDSDGVSIRYIVRGSGPPVVLVHGFMVNTELNWVGPGILDSLAAHYTVIALDLRGHGASEKPHGPSAYGTALVDDVVRLLDHLEIQRAHVVGYSMGAAITLKLLSTHPGRVVSAVLGGFGWRAPELGPSEGVIQLRAQVERAARGETTLADVLAASDSIELTPAVRAALNSNDLDALRAVQAGEAGLREVPQAYLEANTVPVLAVVGERDWARPDVEQMVDVMSNSDVEIIPGATHVTAVFHPLFLESILAFLRSR